FSGTTPGDVYAVPNPQPSGPKTYLGAASILTPPFDQNTLPLIVSGPQLVAVGGTSVPGGTASNLVTDGDVSSMNLTFDRPINVPGFTPALVLGMMGPTGSIIGPRYFPSDGVDLDVPATTSTAIGALDSTLTIPSSGGTFKIQDITVQLSVAIANDSELQAVLEAPDGTMIPLFATVGCTGSNFLNTPFSGSASTPTAQGSAPFTGTFRPAGDLGLLIGKVVDGTWHLLLTNGQTSASATLDSWSLSITP